MSIVKDKISKILEKNKFTLYDLGKFIDFPSGALYDMESGRRPFSEKAIKKLLPVMEISREEFESWILADKYQKEILKLSIKAKKDFSYERKSILIIRIDAVLQNKSMSRAALAKQIDYSQSGLNRMITGQINMSKSVLERISTVFEISQNEILSWIVADKYSLKLLEAAWDCKEV